MKFLLLLAFLPCTLWAQTSKWNIQMQNGKNEGITYEPLSTICFVDSMNGWIGGSKGIIKVTDNGGMSWQDMKTPAEDIITNMFMLDKNTAWMMDYHYPINHMYHTTNAGKTWEKITFELDDVWNITKLMFLDSKTGYFISRGRLFKTTDGGNTWKYTFGDDIHVNSYCFIDRMNGWLLHRTGAMRTSDGGKTWITSRNLTLKKSKDQFPFWIDGLYCDISFADKNNGIISASMVDTFGYLLTTSDGGNTWKKKEFPDIPTFSIHAFPEELASQPDQFMGYISIHHIDQHHAIVKSNSQNIYLTNHQLDYFKPISTILASDMYFITKEKGFSSSSMGIFHTNDGGHTWKCSRELPLPTLMDVYFTDSRNGYAVGLSGSMLKTMNGGETWQPVPIPTKNNLLKVFFTTPHQGWVSSNQGELFHTKDGGASWETRVFRQDIPDQFTHSAERKYIIHQYPDLKYPIDITHRVQMIGNTGWVMGTNKDPITLRESSIIYQTTDGGAHWKEINLNGTFSFSDVILIDRLTAFAIDRNSIYKTVDGGVNWEKLPLNTPNIHMIQIASFHLGQLMITTSKGMAAYHLMSGSIEETPHLLTTTTHGDAYLSFGYTINGQKGWWLMPNMMYETQNGGSKWEQLLPEGFLQIGIHSFAVQQKDIWVVGGNGFIMKLTDTQPSQEEQRLQQLQDKIENFRGLLKR